MGVNDGGIKRGDRADTGDNKAGHTDGVGRDGSGVQGGGGGSTGHPTADPSSLEEPKSGVPTALTKEDEMSVRDEDDPTLGLGDGPEG